MGDPTTQRLAWWVSLGVLIALFAVLSVADWLVVPLLLGVLFALALGPRVTALVRLGVPRGIAAATVLAILAAVLTGLIIATKDPLVALGERAPVIVKQLSAVVTDIGRTVTPRVPASTAAEESAALMVSFAAWVAAELSQLTVGLGLALVLTFFVLTWGSGVGRALLVALRGRRQRRQWLKVCAAIRGEVGRYLRLVTAINIGVGVATAGLLYVFDIEHPWAFGLIAALLNYLPFAGPWITTTLIAITAGTDPSPGVAWVLPPLLFFALHLVESQFVTPSILGRRLSLNPFVVVLGVLVASICWGAGGAFIAVPTLTALKIAADAHPGWRNWGQVLGRGTIDADGTRRAHGGRLLGSIARR
jgi:predicted PurR-regulated permease PerM